MTDTLAHLLADCRRELEAAGIDNSAMDARTLILGILQLTPTELVLKADRQIDEEGRTRVHAAIQRRKAREPVHRILGAREFYGLTLELSPDTLEPRPDTEVLVDALVEHGRRIGQMTERPRLLDLGTGTGAIALALLHELPDFSGLGIDISQGALETARRNADLNGIGERFETMCSDWFAQISGCFDIIVSNPPYIRSDVIGTLEPEVRDFDPLAALDGGPDGLEPYRIIARDADAFLNRNGVLAVEMGFDQKQSVDDIFSSRGYTVLQAVSDYGGNDRALVFKRKSDDFATP
ncbi:peptide chain release factor N(5)-glutamine methyltransferase [Rhizobium helianthi]|uniref:Release factor glutamine methyltransferase n=1 Tax=Rhizobium helianthi TaxID=1132695 RepID=A0ABW4M1M9_9HYPH